MSRPRKPTIELPPHVHAVQANGRTYYYYQPGRGTQNAKGRVRLPDDPTDEAFWTAYGEHANKPKPEQDPRSFAYAIKHYKTTPKFKTKADKTREEYDRYLKIIENAWGALAVADLKPEVVLELQDRYANTPAAANGLVRTLSAFLSWSVPRGYRSDNPCEHVEQLQIGDSWRPWPWEMIELVRDHGPAWMWQATALAVYSGQRQADLIAMPWTALKNGLIEVRQAKTGCHLVIPAHQELLKVLDTMDRKGVCILTSTRGTPWTTDGFKSSWGKAFTGPLAPIREAGLVFHGLRKSAVVMLLEAGATPSEVRAVTGQSLRMVAHYSKEVNQKKLAASAILKLERAHKSKRK